MRHRARLRALCRAMRERRLAAMILSSPANIRYLTGYRGEDCLLIVRLGALAFVTDGRYIEEAAAIAAALRRQHVRAIVFAAPKALPECVGRYLNKPLVAGAEEKHLTHGLWRALLRALPPHSRLKPADDLMARLRRAKDADEQAAIRRAVAIAERALSDFRRMLRQGITEREAARWLDGALVAAGAEAAAFPTIVASGPNASRPHHAPGERRIRSDDVVLVDCGARWRGYISDLTRTFLLGTIKPARVRAYAAVLAVHQAVAGAARAGVAVADLDAQARRILDESRLADRFVHGLGHGIGLVVHELPALRHGANDRLATGDCFTIEPGVYLAGRFGVRLEDDYVVSADGRVRALSRLPKDLAWATLGHRGSR